MFFSDLDSYPLNSLYKNKRLSYTDTSNYKMFGVSRILIQARINVLSDL